MRHRVWVYATLWARCDKGRRQATRACKQVGPSPVTFLPVSVSVSVSVPVLAPAPAPVPVSGASCGSRVCQGGDCRSGGSQGVAVEHACVRSQAALDPLFFETVPPEEVAMSHIAS